MMQALAGILGRTRTVLTLLVAMIIAGTMAYVGVPKEANPDIDVPVFYVYVTQQGISPEDAERLLVRPLETRLRGLDGLKEITGIASEGYGAILLEFTVDFDKDKALADVRAKVDEARAELPSEADEPQVIETNFSLVPTIVVTLSGNVPERTLLQHARRLKDEIESIPTVLEANLVGHREELLEVVIDATRLESYGVSQEQLIRAVTRNNQLIPAGFLDRGAGKFNVKVPGLFQEAADVYGLPVKVEGDAVVTLSDIAEIRRTFHDATAFSRFNGEPAIAIQVVKRLGTNIIANNAEVRRVVAQETADWPETIRIGFTLDMSKFIDEVQGSLQSSILTAIALVMIVVVAALGMRSALLIGLAIPTSFLIGFLIVSLLGMTVNMMVMFGLVLTVGMLVDGAIVIVEYADRKMAEGLNRKEAYTLAAQRMFWPIFSSTATTLAAFLPMLLWPGVSGEFMSYLPIMVVIVLTAALFTAMIFLPVLGGIFGKTSARPEDMDEARKLAGTSRVDYREIRGFTGIYVRFLKIAAGHPLGNLAVIAGALVVCVGVFVAFGRHNAGVEFFVEEEPEQVVVLVRGRGNLSAAEQRDLVLEAERQILEIDGIETVFSTIGQAGAGGPQVGGVQDKPNDVIGELLIELSDYCCRRKSQAIFAELRERTAPIPGIIVEIRKVEGGPPTGKDIRLEVTSSNYEQVKAAADLVRRHLETEVEGLRDIEDSRPLPGIEWKLTVDRQEAGRFGADVASVGGMIQLVTNGILVGKYRPDDSEDEIEIRVRLPEAERNLDRLDSLRISTPAGMVPIRNFVQREAQPKVSSITRQNGRYAIDVKANVVKEDGYLADDKVRELEAWLRAQDWPVGTSFRFRGADEEQKEAQDFLGKAALASLFIMFVILVTQFNSFYQTILTLSTVIMSVVGVLIGMLVTGQKFSVIMTGTGVVALAGIVVNNAIVLIDTHNRLSESGLSGLDAVLRSCAQRLRPILLTTITTIMGLVPMALQINFDFFAPSIHVGGITSIWWVQLSTAVIFGLGFSTVLTLIVIPTMLAMPSVWRDRWQAWRGRRHVEAAEAMPVAGTPPARPALPQAAE
ncbi:multidrug efflux pump [Tepidamorphus gemmatus]|uniref:Multidrug efflux pump n=1 Tax=Tepidamorphus gemmatus TaxID=747076 RepID=A0A4R3LXP1_9HYPH|nr:efflux RND transporter permease subunit [Tepidamorphus gemmatus]TCT05414.1 multidrug efflux pump [Tepidamorphus gemmatus]